MCHWEQRWSEPRGKPHRESHSTQYTRCKGFEAILNVNERGVNTLRRVVYVSPTPYIVVLCMTAGWSLMKILQMLSYKMTWLACTTCNWSATIRVLALCQNFLVCFRTFRLFAAKVIIFSYCVTLQCFFFLAYMVGENFRKYVDAKEEHVIFLSTMEKNRSTQW